MTLLRRLRGARWIGAGLADQVVIATANAANTFLGIVVLNRDDAGLMLLTMAVTYFVMYLNRAFVGDVLLTLAPRYDGDRRAALVRNALTTAVTVGLVGAVVLVGLWAVWPRGGDTDLRDLIWIAPFLPVILLHDTGRFGYLADRKPEQALVIDLVWVATQAVAVAAGLAIFGRSAAVLLAAWGIGAAAGAVFYLVRAKASPLRGDPRRWFTQTRHLSGWFTATALVGQAQVLSVGFIVAIQLSAAEVAGLRLVQVAVLQPVQNVVTAVQGLIVPRLSRLAGDATQLSAVDERAAAATALRRQTRQLALGFAGLGLVLVAVVAPLGWYLLSLTGRYADVAPLALPIAVQGAIYLLQVPFTGALRAMHRARLLFLQYLVFTATSLTGLVVGAGQAGLLGAGWGLATGSAVGLVVMIALYRHSSRRLGDASAERVVADTTAS
jgi:O-antigen/teichoic acid export membrane protein